MYKLIRILLAGAFTLSASASAVHARAADGVATIPMYLEMDRPYVDLSLTGTDGKPVRARFWLDTGGGAILISQGLAKRLRLDPQGRAFNEEGSELIATTVPKITVGGMPLGLSDPHVFIVLNAPEHLQGTDADGALPLRLLNRYQVVFDYPERTFTVAAAGKLQPVGTAIKSKFGKTEMPVVTLEVDGARHDFLLDTGGTYCMMSTTFMAGLVKRHPDWPHVQGAFGPANMLFGDKEMQSWMLRIGKLQWGPFTLTDVGTVSRPADTYEKWMSQIAGWPIVGSIGGNVLHSFRVDIDYPDSKVFLSGKPIPGAGLDMVGIMIEPANPGFVVRTTAMGVNGIRAGDRLLKVAGLDVQHATLADIMQALSGKPGESRVIEIERNGGRQQVRLRVQHIL